MNEPHSLPWPLLFTSPHSGEVVPNAASWLHSVDPLVRLTDVDRFVDELYAPVAQKWGVPMVKAPFHRYAVDLNRIPSDVDDTLVVGAQAHYGAPHENGYVSGFHWKKTTQGAALLAQPMSWENHQRLIEICYEPFHKEVGRWDDEIVLRHGRRFHLDLHSMPSRGTGVHRDAGSQRPDVVVSDGEGRSSTAVWAQAVVRAFEKQGFQVGYNWPYKGGRMTLHYGQPNINRNSLQIELNRSLYMDEVTREKNHRFPELQTRLGAVCSDIIQSLPQ